MDFMMTGETFFWPTWIPRSTFDRNIWPSRMSAVFYLVLSSTDDITYGDRATLRFPMMKCQEEHCTSYWVLSPKLNMATHSTSIMLPILVVLKTEKVLLSSAVVMAKNHPSSCQHILQLDHTVYRSGVHSVRLHILSLATHILIFQKSV